MQELPGKEKAKERIYLLSSTSNNRSPVGFSQQRGCTMCLFTEIQNSARWGWESPDLSVILALFWGAQSWRLPEDLQPQFTLALWCNVPRQKFAFINSLFLVTWKHVGGNKGRLMQTYREQDKMFNVVFTVSRIFSKANNKKSVKNKQCFQSLTIH